MKKNLFRGKRRDSGEYVEGYFVGYNDEAYIFEQGEVDKGIDLGGYLDCCQMTEVDPLTVELSTHEELRHFLEFEIEQTTEWLKDKSNPRFNGVAVGIKEAHRLKELHIRFCQHMLAMMNT